MPTVTYVTVPDNQGASVLVNGVTVYHEDDDDNRHQEFSASMVAVRLAEALVVEYQIVNLTWDDLNKDEWNFNDVEDAVNRKGAMVIWP